jgi:carbon storage regulator CsrA
MMIFNRRIEDAIQIGEEITVKVINVADGRVQLGFNAPTSVNIRRIKADPKVMAVEAQRQAKIRSGTDNKKK